MSAPALKSVLEALYARAPRGMDLGLDSIRASCTRFGFPERAFPAVHIAGTNGKGSTSAMVERIAREAGLTTGLYTSPHLHRFAERIRIAGEPIDDAMLARLLGEVLHREPGLTFFEAATLTAFLAFREAHPGGVDLAVIEVGIGGRLDATNVIPPPRAAAITRIALDHQDKLGETLTDIAREKAAIAKPGVDVILGPMPADVEAAIAEIAHRAGATTSRARELTAGITLGHIGLEGAHQADNARIAWAIGERLGFPRAAIERGIASVTWAGRLERVDTAEGPMLLDAAHNPDGAESLARQLESMQSAGTLVPADTALVFGALADKAWPGMIDRIAPFAGTRIYVRPQGRAATDPALIAARCPGDVADSFEEALARVRGKVGRGLVLVTGSIFLVAEARGKVLGIAGDPALAL